MRALIAALGEFYPCTWCASDFRKRVAEHEPDVSGRRGLSRWFCERHNEVNEKLGKERFDCDKVMQRWKDGPPDGSCD
jgi:FAD-linked sulfhydryl oxidase